MMCRDWVIKNWEDRIQEYEDFKVSARDLIYFLKVDPFEAFKTDPSSYCLLKQLVYAYESDLCSNCAAVSHASYCVLLSTV